MARMNNVFMISGGAGRVITAIPALEKFARLNPDNDFKVIIHGWESLYWNHPILQQRTFGIHQKGLFDLIIKSSKLVVPEPYHVFSYYNQQSSLTEAFDEEINKDVNHSDLPALSLYCHTNEILSARKMIEEAKRQKNKKKFIVYQPFGSGMKMVDNIAMDPSYRSLSAEDALNLGCLLSNDAAVLYFGPNEFIHPEDKFMLNAKDIPNADLRFYMAMISQCDYFVGVDSVGQHMARAFNKPGTVIMGSTFEKNVTYDDHFKIVRNGKTPVYNPIRIGGIDCEFADRANDGIMTFTREQIINIYHGVKECL